MGQRKQSLAGVLEEHFLELHFVGSATQTDAEMLWHKIHLLLLFSPPGFLL